MPDLNNDAELIKDFLKGNESSFNRIVLKYKEKIYWHARRMTGNHLDADEVLQEVLLVMYKKLAAFEHKSSLYTWIYTITNTRSINYLKRRSIRNIFSLDDIRSRQDDKINIIADLDKKEKLKTVERILQKLPVKQREIFIMRNYDELSYEEASQMTGKSIGALKANYFHALNKVKELMKEYE